MVTRKVGVQARKLKAESSVDRETTWRWKAENMAGKYFENGW